ncbi:MAG: ERCC4 domain-containing protein, partial [archaeon]
GKEISFKELTHVHKHKRTNKVLRVKLSSGFDTLVTENHSLISFNENAHQKAQEPTLNSFIELAGIAPNITNTNEINIVKEFIENVPENGASKLFCSIQGITQAKIRIYKSDLKVLQNISCKTPQSSLQITTQLDASTITNCLKRLTEKGATTSTKTGKNKLIELTENGLNYLAFLQWFFTNVHYYKKKYRCSLNSVHNSQINLENFCPIKIEYLYGKTKIDLKIRVTSELAKFLGFYVAEGNARKTKTTSGIHLAAQKIIMQNNMEKSVKEGLGLKYSRNWRGIDINSQIAYLLIKYVFKCGETAYEKEVPEVIFNASTEVKWAFIEAYCRGDGHVEKGRISFTTVSRKLATGIILLLRQLGIKRVRIDKGTLRTQYYIQIFESFPFHTVNKNKGKGAYYNTRPTALISPKAYALFQNKYERDAKHTKSRTHSPQDKDIYYDYIKIIEPLKTQPLHVYDISVKENETFCGGTGLMTLHNSVAEEGLDIPSVDLVVFFEPVPSEIRTIQRRGRTGRFGKGKAIILMAKNTRDEAFYWSSRAKERKMKETLRTMKKTDSLKLPEQLPEQTLLSTFAKENEKGEEHIIIFADSRESASSVTKELFGKEKVKIIVKPLDVGDYILSKDVCVERKTTEDFLNSMLDGRMFEQLVRMRQNYPKPLVIIEGKMDELFTMRNIHKNSVIGALTSIALDYQVPIINTKSESETAEYIYSIAKREQLGKDTEVRLRTGRKGLTLSDQQRFIIEGLPMVGPALAKSLLEKFGSIKQIANAGELELQKVEGLGKKKAHIIRKVLDEKFDEKNGKIVEEETNTGIEETENIKNNETEIVEENE